MWDELAKPMDAQAIIEYGTFQRERKPNAPMWRRHKGATNFRFTTLFNALFAEKGARNACYGRASYPKSTYAVTGVLLVPYVATWVKDAPFAYLVRASAGDPEITIVPVSSVEALNPSDEASLSEELAEIFAEGAAQYGIRLLGERSIRRQ